MSPKDVKKTSTPPMRMCGKMYGNTIFAVIPVNVPPKLMAASSMCAGTVRNPAKMISSAYGIRCNTCVMTRPDNP